MDPGQRCKPSAGVSCDSDEIESSQLGNSFMLGVRKSET